MNPSSKIRSASGKHLAMASTSSGGPSCTTIHRFAEKTAVPQAPARRCLSLSVPGTSGSKSWPSCLMVATLSPLPCRMGISLVISVVFPEFFTPLTAIITGPGFTCSRFIDSGFIDSRLIGSGCTGLGFTCSGLIVITAGPPPSHRQQRFAFPAGKSRCSCCRSRTSSAHCAAVRTP